MDDLFKAAVTAYLFACSVLVAKHVFEWLRPTDEE